MVKNILSIICFISGILSTLPGFTQTIDTSAINISKLSKRKIYYINQSRKTNVPESNRKIYEQKITEVDKILEEIENAKRTDALSKGEDALKKFKKDSSERNAEFEMAKLFTPDLYPVELGAWTIGGQFSLLKPFTYTTPVQLYFDKTIKENLTAGVFIGHMTELDQFGKGYSYEGQKDWSYTVRSKNYIYSNVMFGIRGAYHFFSIDNPILNLNPVNWDFYIGGLIGYNLATKPEPFLTNRSFERLPKKGGINFGIYPGVRYMYDKYLGFTAEIGYGKTSYANIGICFKIVKSDVILDKPTNEEKTNDKGKKAKNSKNSKNSKGKNSKGKKK